MYLLIMNHKYNKLKRACLLSTLVQKDMKKDQLLSESNPIDFMILISL